MEGETQEPVKDLNELQNADWVRAIPQAKMMVLNAFRLGSVKSALWFRTCFSTGTVLGAGNEGPKTWCEAEEGPRASI